MQNQLSYCRSEAIRETDLYRYENRKALEKKKRSLKCIEILVQRLFTIQIDLSFICASELHVLRWLYNITIKSKTKIFRFPRNYLR